MQPSSGFAFVHCQHKPKQNIFTFLIQCLPNRTGEATCKGQDNASFTQARSSTIINETSTLIKVKRIEQSVWKSIIVLLSLKPILKRRNEETQSDECGNH